MIELFNSSIGSCVSSDMVTVGIDYKANCKSAADAKCRKSAAMSL